MLLTPEQRRARLERRATELTHWIDRAHRDLDQWSFDGAPLAVGAAWPRRDGVIEIAHPAVTVPDDWPLEETRLALDLGGESLLQLDYGNGSTENFGLDPYHQRFPLQQRTCTIRAQSVARLPFGIPNRDARIGTARLVLIEPEVEALVRLLTLVGETVAQLNGHEAAPALLDCAERAFYGLDWPSATDTYLARIEHSYHMRRIWEPPHDLDPHPAGLNQAQRASVAEARRTLVEGLEALKDRYPQQGALAMTGHAHIDLAWLWPIEETWRKASRTFSSMVGLMDRHPSFRFNQSSAALYDAIETEAPALFARIKEKVAAGQWETLGGMWVEPDTNMPTGESFVRQLLYGQRYFERTFGQRHRVCWLPDCFGFSPALPQLLQLAGIDSFFTIKVNWSETNAMPHDLFWWEGLDGSRVLAHTFNNPVGGYNAVVTPEATLKTWSNFRGKHDHPESLLSFGWGDGGGGPTEDMLERADLLAHFPVLPALRQARVEDYYTAAHETAARRDLPTWLGEMYLETHRGTLTTQGRTKYLHRRAERDLIAAETVAGLAHMLGAPAPASEEAHWRLILRNQFHDILPGSSIGEVYQRTEQELGAVVTHAATVIEDKLQAIAGRLAQPGDADGILVVNPDLSTRPLTLISSGALPGGQTVEGGSVIASDRPIGPLSAAVILQAEPPAGLAVSENSLENGQVRVALAADGTLASVYDKAAEREVLAGHGNQLWAYVDKPREYDAWDIEEDYEGRGEEITDLAERTIVEHGPHRAAIRIVRRFRDSTITQHLRLWANSPRIDVATHIDWHERRFLVKARFPLLVRADHASFECAFGVIRRPTHANTTWDRARFEVAGHRFVDLAEHGYGAALLNDGKYGFHARGNELGISLLRSPTYPDPYADEGEQSFTYALLPHRGDWLAGGVLAEAEALNRPLLARPVQAAVESDWQGPRLDGMQLGLGALKPAEAGEGLVLRVYEPAGARGRVALTLPEGWALGEEINLLEDTIGPADLEIRPFQLRSWHLLPQHR